MESAIPDYIQEAVRSLPPLPSAVSRLLTMVRDPDVGFNEIATVIGSDQTLTARVLRAANSAIYGVSRRVETLQQATVLLGSETVVNLTLSVAVLRLEVGRRASCPLDPGAFWRHSLAVAVTAQHLARHLAPAEGSRAFVAGLMHDIGKLIFVEHFGETYDQVLLAAQYGTQPLHRLEQEVLDVTHPVAGHALCLHWNLPPSITRALTEHHVPEELPVESPAGLVRAANELVKRLGLGDSGNGYTELRDVPAQAAARIQPDAWRTLVTSLPTIVAEAAEVLGAGTTATPMRVPERTSAEDRPLVHVQVTHVAEADVLQDVLWALGYEPVRIDAEGAATRTPSLDQQALGGLVTDLPVTPTRELAYCQHGARVLDYAAWRAQHQMPNDGFCHVGTLRTWLDEGLPAATARAA